ncbi:LOW QUALITY PROTEIN: E3 ubiquitin-protein ligase RNF31 [Bombina bombina]|uniref:LOW QUALITY PROTEIN: E3 ubiquitin-protein ligase RNF31 n=1 Tax=Bombina bombina TaxID=8345 RepID=UPI00235ACFA1|nr:LOW QUALITY PROTEIN: E3 ubiquitin-protein ligase RNF31 [Bombina bombina]
MEEKELRDVLEQALINQPEHVTLDLLDQMLEVPLRERYRRLDVKDLLRGGTPDPSLRPVITALNILEKYGRNLLSPLRPKFWRSVKFNNPVFKATVDAIEVMLFVHSAVGHSRHGSDGLSFPESVQEPDLSTVAASDPLIVIILHREQNLLISNSHPKQEKAMQELLGDNMEQKKSLVADSALVSQTPSPGVVSVTCSLCGVFTVSVLCSACNDIFCAECDKRMHSHPNRTHHQRSPYSPVSTHRPLEQSTLSSLPSRPPWKCYSCYTLNRGESVLCVGCDRPRGCTSSPSSLGDQLQRDSWECQACTFQNNPSAVLCAVCDRPRLASKPSQDSHETVIFPAKALHEMAALPSRDSLETTDLPLRDSFADSFGPLIDNTGSHEEGLKPFKQEGWQCSHCTFYNTNSGRVCEMCNKTNEETQSVLYKKESLQRLSLDQEEIRQRSLREDGAKLVALIREGESSGITPEEVYSAVRYSGTEKPLQWLQTELPYVLERVMDAASQRGVLELGALTSEEARSAWVSSGGDMEDAITVCLSERRIKVETLCNLGFNDKDKVVSALYESSGDVGRALTILQRPILEPFLTRMWEETQPPLNLDSGDRSAILRRLLAEHALHSWGRAELALSLLQEAEGRFVLQDVLEAVRESHDRDFIKRMLIQECAVCGWELPRNKMRSLTSCECCICPDCFRTHFTVALKEKHIRDMVCPACEEPEISDEGELLHYFSTLDILLRDTLDVDAYNLFHKKLTERTLMKDPKFLWCTHCSFGFIYERDQLDVKCPQCECSFCRNCKRPWEEQHRSLNCEDFQNWKRENDAEYQAQGLAVYLQENGITCPHCKFSYALARGGCMHFICSQCRHQFCSGCYNTFHPKNKCMVPSCTVKLSLHSHHPRDCLFYLRDWEVFRLQKLLQLSQVPFNTDPPAGTQVGPGGGCRVMEQKETLEGLMDEACGKVTTQGYAGLCESHYKEYLVSRINALSLDPCVLYDLNEAITVCQRYLPSPLPRDPNENDGSYRERLLRMLIAEVPLTVNLPRKP